MLWCKNFLKIGLKLSRNTDAELIAQLEKQDNIQNYLKELIRNDIIREQSQQD